MFFPKSMQKSLIRLALLFAAAYGAMGHAQPVTHSGSGADLRTERRVVRPGCAVMVMPGYPNYRYIGGSCPDGLLEGIVKLDRALSDTTLNYLMKFQRGKDVAGPYLRWVGDGSKGFTTMTLDESGTTASDGRAKCEGRNADERANSNSYCQEAARIFGMEAFNGSGVPGSQMAAASGTSAGSSSRDDPVVVGGAWRP